MKKVFLIAFALTLALALVAVSTPAIAAVEVAGDAYIGVYDKYLWRGFDLSGSLPVAQGGTDISIGNVTVSYWTSTQLTADHKEGFKSGEGNETDIVIDYSRDLNDLVSVSVGNIFYTLDGLDDTHELYFSVGLGTILAPSLTVYYDWDEAQSDGLFITASIGHDFELSDKISLSVGALASANQASDYAVGSYRDAHNYELSAGLDIALTDTLSANVSGLFSEGLSHAAKRAIDTESTGGVSVTYAF